MRHAPLSGRYELEEIVGTGGMSVVYRAWDMKYDSEVAIKVLRPEYVGDEEFLRRFNAEAQAASQMSMSTSTTLRATLSVQLATQLTRASSMATATATSVPTTVSPTVTL